MDHNPAATQPPRLRIAIACSSICHGRGGSERAASRLANYLAGQGHAVHLLSLRFNDHETVPAYPLDPRVLHEQWPFSQKHADIQRHKAQLVAANTDVLLSMQSCSMHLFWSMVCMGSGIPFVCSERTSPERTETMLWSRAGRYAMLSGADCIHELLPAYVETLPQWCRNRAAVIPNAAPEKPVLTEAEAQRRYENEDGPRVLLYLSRLAKPKRPDLLIDAFNLLAKDQPQWELHIYGHGNLEETLQQQVAQSPHRERICLHGVCTSTARAYASAHLYCLPTEFEGFPNAVLEAMSAGLPVVGFGRCQAMREIVRHGVTGSLADENSAESLAQALQPLMADAALRQRMGQQARQECSNRYDARTVHKQWEQLFYTLAQRKGNTVMDSFSHEPFASKARLSAVARREWLWREFGQPMPWTCGWLRQKFLRLVKGLFQLHNK